MAGIQPAPLSNKGPNAQPPPALQRGLDQALHWRDYLFAYQGRLSWDGQGTMSSLELRAVDSGSGLVVAQGRLNALLLPNTGALRVV
ncbi:MAG: hypothetical protein LH480_05890 [Rubrivivax sp.]|nr:hypothetical protein [Rubrivivax sp.]